MTKVLKVEGLKLKVRRSTDQRIGNQIAEANGSKRNLKVQDWNGMKNRLPPVPAKCPVGYRSSQGLEGDWKVPAFILAVLAAVLDCISAIGTSRPGLGVMIQNSLSPAIRLPASMIVSERARPLRITVTLTR